MAKDKSSSMRKEEALERDADFIDRHLHALRCFANALRGSCIYFEGVFDEKSKLEAMRIDLDVWECPELIDYFVYMRNSWYRRIDYGALAEWRDNLHCPIWYMGARGNTAHFLCEGTVFEVVSHYGDWHDMLPGSPTLVLATLFPYKGHVSFCGAEAIECPPKEFDEEKIRREYEDAMKRGIVSDASAFKRRAQEINAIHVTLGLEPTYYRAFINHVKRLNKLTEDTCFPYESIVRGRGWDNESQRSAHSLRR